MPCVQLAVLLVRVRSGLRSRLDRVIEKRFARVRVRVRVRIRVRVRVLYRLV